MDSAEEIRSVLEENLSQDQVNILEEVPYKSREIKEHCRK